MRTATYALLIILLTATQSLAGFGSYVFDFGSESWAPDGTTDSADADGNFWVHDYYTYDGVSRSHVGTDYNMGSAGDSNAAVRSHGFGLLQKNGDGTYGTVSIQHLLNCGENIYVNLLHSKDFDTWITNGVGNWIVRGQKVGMEGNTGAGAFHLHVECSNQTYSRFMPSWAAVPKSSAGRTSSNYVDGLLAHYGTDNTAAWYFNPNDFKRYYQELIPTIGRNPGPTTSDYDVYGVAGKPLYGQLDFYRQQSKNFYALGIIARNGTMRSDETSISVEQGKWLAHSWDDVSVGWSTRPETDVITIEDSEQLTGNFSYAAGDYMFKAFVADSATDYRFGYPVLLCVLPNDASRIVDNDQQDDGAYAFALSDNGAETYTAPGYYLTAKFLPGQSGGYATWSPGKSGNYSIEVYVPVGASGTVRYKIKPDGSTTVLSSPVNQAEHQGQWVTLTSADGGSFQFTTAGYVGISLAPAENPDASSEDRVGIDAVKFLSAGAVSLPFLDILLGDEGAGNTTSEITRYFPLHGTWKTTAGDYSISGSGEDWVIASTSDPSENYANFKVYKYSIVILGYSNPDFMPIRWSLAPSYLLQTPIESGRGWGTTKINGSQTIEIICWGSDVSSQTFTFSHEGTDYELTYPECITIRMDYRDVDTDTTVTRWAYYAKDIGCVAVRNEAGFLYEGSARSMWYLIEYTP